MELEFLGSEVEEEKLEDEEKFIPQELDGDMTFLESDCDCERVVSRDRNRRTEIVSEEEIEREIPVFTYEQISEIYPDAIGNPYGDYGEKLDFAKWVLETMYIHGSDSLLKTFLTNFDKEITTEFFQNIADVKTRRLRELKNSIFYRVVPLNYYYREWINTKSKLDFTSYSFSKNGKIQFISREGTTGNFTRRNLHKEFQKWIPKSQFDEMMDNLKKLQERVIEQGDRKVFWKEVALDNLFCVFEGREGKEVHRELTEIEYNAIEKIKKGKQKYFMTKCEFCKGIIKFPLTPNLDTDKDEALAHMIYTCALNQCGRVLCKKCLDNVWDEKEVRDTYKDVKPDKAYKIDVEKFCGAFRKDKRVIEVEEVGKWLANFLGKEGIEKKVWIDGSVLVIY